MREFAKYLVFISFWVLVSAADRYPVATNGPRDDLILAAGQQSVANPVTPGATAKTRTLLRYFYKLSRKKKADSKRVISGQFIGTATYNLSKDHDLNITSLKQATGRTPLIFGLDYGWEEMVPQKILLANKYLIDHSNLGGIVTVNFSLNNPWTQKGLNSLGFGRYQFDDLFKTGTEPNRNFTRDLAIIAGGLKDLKDHQVTVLVRPFQEMNGNWFWWSGSKAHRLSQKEFRKMWIYVFKYFTDKKKLNNLLWVFSAQYEFGNSSIFPMNYYYPGNEYVDIVGFSYYQGDLVLGDSYYDLVKIGKPVALAEFGPSNKEAAFGHFDNLKLLEVLKNDYDDIVYFMYWAGWKSFGIRMKKTIVENANASLLMNDDLVLSREDVHQ